MTRNEQSPRAGLSFIERVMRAAPRYAVVGGLALGATGCVAEQHDYSDGEAKRTVGAGTDVYDNTNGLGAVKKCGKTAQDATALPVMEYRTEGNAVGDGQVQLYAFNIGGENGLPLQDGHSCEDSVWVYANQAPVAAQNR